MMRRSILSISMIMVLFSAGCIKETYDMNKLSGEVQLTPTIGISAIKGDISLSDIVKQSDTVVFDQDNFVRLVFRKDNVIDLKLEDFYDLNDMVYFSQSYTLSDLSIANFQRTITYVLGNISALNDGSPHPIPPFASIDLGEQIFSFSNFENAVFASGFLRITVKNNLDVRLDTIYARLYNTAGHTEIGNGITIPPIDAHQSQIAYLDLTDETVTNSVSTAVVISGSPGNTTPVLITPDNSNIQVTIEGRDLKVRSGRVILPLQKITSPGNKVTVDFDPGSGVEIDSIKITTGRLSYHIQKLASVSARLTVTLPTVKTGNPPAILSKIINTGAGSQFNGFIALDNSVFDLGTDPDQPYNRLPMTYEIEVSSNNAMVSFNSADKVQLDLELLDPTFDFVKGYFGQMEESIAPETLNLEIDDILHNISGTFLIADPTIKLNYSNSFSIPVKVSLDAIGKRQYETVNLNLDPFLITYPIALANRDASASVTIDKSNSSLPELLSMPPGEIIFSGSAIMNPSGNNGMRDNYVFGNSRLLASLEVEVPLEFWMNNLQFTDTVENFLKDEGNGDDYPVKPADFKMLQIDLTVKNGFPLGASIIMSLYDSKNDKTLATVDATELLGAAPIDVNGEANNVTETITSINFTEEFFSSVDEADKIIFQFTLNTTAGDSKNIKIYSDYRIEFNAALVVKPVINLK